MKGESSVQLLHVCESPFALRVEMALALKQVEYNKVPQDLLHKSPLLLASNPVYEKVPVLIHEGKVLCESSIIVQYVDEAWPSPQYGLTNLLPSHPYDKAIARFWGDFVDKKVFRASFSILMSEGEERRVAIENFMATMAVVEEALGSVPKEPPFFGGSTIGFVDIMLGPILAWLPTVEEIGNFTFPFEKHPHFHGWYLAFKEHPISSIFPKPPKITEFVTEVVFKRYGPKKLPFVL